MKNKNNTILYQSLCSLIRRDKTPMRSQMLCHLLQDNPPLKIINHFYLKCDSFTRFCLIWLFAFYNLIKLPKVSGKHESVAITVFKNEKIAIQKFDKKIKIFDQKHSPKLLFISFKLVRLSYLFAKRKSLLHGLRGFSLILNYCYLQKQKFKITKLYGSSEGCPIIYAYIAYAKTKSIPTTFIAHGLCQKDPDKIFYNEIYLMNEREKNRYEKKFPGTNIKLLLKKKPLQSFTVEKVIGIIGSNMMNWKYLDAFYQTLYKKFPTHQIVLRRHPNEIIKKNQPLKIRESSGDLMTCEYIIGGNSSYLEELRQNGKKVFYEAKLDFAPYDAYGLIEEKLIPEFSSEHS